MLARLRRLAGRDLGGVARGVELADRLGLAVRALLGLDQPHLDCGDALLAVGVGSRGVGLDLAQRVLGRCARALDGRARRGLFVRTFLGGAQRRFKLVSCPRRRSRGPALPRASTRTVRAAHARLERACGLVLGLLQPLDAPAGIGESPRRRGQLRAHAGQFVARRRGGGLACDRSSSAVCASRSPARPWFPPQSPTPRPRPRASRQHRARPLSRSTAACASAISPAIADSPPSSARTGAAASASAWAAMFERSDSSELGASALVRGDLPPGAPGGAGGVGLRGREIGLQLRRARFGGIGSARSRAPAPTRAPPREPRTVTSRWSSPAAGPAPASSSSACRPIALLRQLGTALARPWTDDRGRQRLRRRGDPVLELRPSLIGPPRSRPSQPLPFLARLLQRRLDPVALGGLPVSARLGIVSDVLRLGERLRQTLVHLRRVLRDLAARVAVSVGGGEFSGRGGRLRSGRRRGGGEFLGAGCGVRLRGGRVRRRGGRLRFERRHARCRAAWCQAAWRPHVRLASSSARRSASPRAAAKSARKTVCVALGVGTGGFQLVAEPARRQRARWRDRPRALAPRPAHRARAVASSLVRASASAWASARAVARRFRAKLRPPRVRVRARPRAARLRVERRCGRSRAWC